METSAPRGSVACTVLLKWGVAATRPASSRHSVAARAIVLFIGTSVAEARSVDLFSGSLLTQGDDRVETRRASGRKPRRRQPAREEDRRDAGEHERVGGAHLEEERPERAREGSRARESGQEADAQERDALAEEERQDRPRDGDDRPPDPHPPQSPRRRL